MPENFHDGGAPVDVIQTSASIVDLGKKRRKQLLTVYL